MAEIVLVGGRSLQVTQSRAVVNDLMQSASFEVVVRTYAGGASSAVLEDVATVQSAHVSAVIE